MKKSFLTVILGFLMLQCHKKEKLSVDQNTLIIEDLVVKSKDYSQPMLVQRQLTDSLLILVSNQKPGSERRKNLLKVANRYYNQGEHCLEKIVTQKVIVECINAKDSLLLAKAYQYRGDYFQVLKSQDSALLYYFASSKIYRNKGDLRNVAKLALEMSYIKVEANDLTGAEILALESLRSSKYFIDKQDLALTYNILAIISHKLEDYNRAAEMYENGISVLSGMDTETSISERNLVNYNLAVMYLEQRQLKKAYKIFEDLLSDDIYKRDSNLYALSLCRYAKLRNILFPGVEDVLPLFTRSISIHDSVSLPQYRIMSRTQFVDYYLSVGDTANAKTVSVAAYNLATNYCNDKFLILETLHNLIRADPHNAAKYSLHYIHLSDSLKLAERQIRDKFERIEYETDELTAELDSEKTSKGIYTIIFGIIVGIAGVIIFLIYKNLESIKKKSAQFKKMTTKEFYNMILGQHGKVLEGKTIEKARISRELHDGILNDLSFVRNSIAMAIAGDNSEGVKKCAVYLDRLQLIEKEIHAMSRDLRNTTFDVESYRTLLNDLFAFQESISDIKWHFFQSVDVKWKKIDKQLKTNIYRILQEVIENANKYSTASHASIEINKIENELRIDISDNGVGFDKNLKSNGIGLQNIQMRVTLDGGTFDLETDTNAGVKIILVYPI